VVPCILCLEWLPDGDPVEDTIYGQAEYDPATGRWEGTFNGIPNTFTAYWAREGDVCKFFVLIDDVEVATFFCEELDFYVDGVTCRNPDEEVATIIDEISGVLRWRHFEDFPLQYITTDDGCTDFFCGNCECTCYTLCVTIRAWINDVSAFFLEGEGEIPLVSYDQLCDPPVWQGTVDTIAGALEEAMDVYVYLYRDPYTGDCYLTGEARGQELTPTKVYDCAQIGVTFTLEDTSVVIVACKRCECTPPLCEFCCLPLDFSNPNYPGGVIAGIPYSMTCGDTTISGSFANSDTEPCVEEILMYGPEWTVPSPVGIHEEGITPDYRCPTTPCDNEFTLLLECTSRFSGEGDDVGCDRLWLWVGSRYPLVGDIGEEPPSAGGFARMSSWLRIGPTSCACDPDSGVAAIFNFGITIDCSVYPTGLPGGPCEGVRLGCCEYSCDGVVTI
jgi:hypothetical protein